MSARCEICGGSGWVDEEETRSARPCRCRPQLIAGRRARSLSAVIPKKYRGLSFERPPITSMPDYITRAVRSYLRRLDEQLADGRGLWFYGDVGTGKTTLAMLVSQTALDDGHTVAIYSLPRLLAEIRSTFDSDESGAYVRLIDRLADVDLLHLDDVGAEKTSEWVLEQLYAIINARYEAQRSVMITTNLERDALAGQIGERTVSRLDEMCELLPLLGEDNRKIVHHDRREPPPGDLRLA